MTSMEREEKEKVKKREKKLEDEEILQQATWVKYTIPIKHQVKPPPSCFPLGRSQSFADNDAHWKDRCNLQIRFPVFNRCGSRRGRNTE